MANKIRALFTFEILGRPPEHIKETMSQLIDKLGELPGINIERKKIHEPKPLEDKDAKDLFTTFSEVEILGKDIDSLTTVVFYAMPSHVEIIEPGELAIRNCDLTSLLSSITAKLHRYDEIAKAMMMERNILVNKIKEMQEKISQLEGNTQEKKSTEDEKATKSTKKTKNDSKGSKKK